LTDVAAEAFEKMFDHPENRHIKVAINRNRFSPTTLKRLQNKGIFYDKEAQLT
jgi:hypothetical protein